MCKAFGCLITKSKKVYWKAGVDSHDVLVEMFKKRDKELRDDKEPPRNTFARIEITPKDGDYLRPEQKWVYRIDEKVKPEWLDKSYEKPCYQALRKWQKQVYRFNLREARNPIHPFKIKPPKTITAGHLRLLAKWDSVKNSVESSVRISVWDSVWASVGDSVWDSVRISVWSLVWASVGDSVWDLVKNSVWISVRDSVGAYIGSLFPCIKKWKYCEKVEEKGYPFKSVVKLWKMGLVPSFDGAVWRLHGGKKAEILWKGTRNELEKYFSSERRTNRYRGKEGK